MRSEGRIAEGIDSLLRAARIPGCSVAVVGRDGIVWSDAFGDADIAKKTPAVRSTVYHLFSGTKLFTATAVLQLVEGGRLDLDARVTAYLPELSQLRDIGLRDLVTHRSGLGETLRGFMAVWFPGDDPPSTSEALAAYTLRPGGAPGRTVRYRNVNYAILGEVVSRVSGLPYRDYVRERVLAPLSSDAGFEVSAFDAQRLATGYLRRRDPTRVLLRFLFPSLSRRLYRGIVKGGWIGLNDYNLSTASIGGLVGSVDSFVPFLRSQLNGGVPLLSEKTTRLMQTLAARGKAGIESREGVGLGWKIGVAGGRRFLNHEGCGAGFTTELRLYPDEAFGVVVLMNLSSISRTMRVAHEVCELIRESREGLPPGAGASRRSR
jgi:D-alanyl-D-alanine carboxypeptidase